MGNLEEKLAQARPLEELEGTIKHLQETRSDSQIEITNKLTHLLSDLNTQRIMSNQSLSAKKLDWSEYVFFCIQGLPALKNEFSMLDLPGETIYFSSIIFTAQESNNQESIQKLIYECTFKKEADRLHQIFSQIKKNNIVFIYHSLGNYMLSMYFHYYGYDLAKKIKGMIDISGGPLRHYTAAQLLAPIIRATEFKEILQNGEKAHQYFMKSLSSTGFDLAFKSKYQTIASFHYIKSPQYAQIFEASWHHPGILKLFIHGRRDTLFNSHLLNEKAIYYTYRRQLDKEYEARLLQKYEDLYKPKVTPKNLQERFILAIPKGQHSVHNQQRNHELIRCAVHQYLIVIHQ